MSRRPAASPRTFPLIAAVLAAAVTAGAVVVAQARRDFDVVARRYSFKVSGNDRAEIRVTQNDLVHITFSTDDIPHSFTIETTTTATTASCGAPSRASRSPSTSAPTRPAASVSTAASPPTKCKGMHGTLVVDPK